MELERARRVALSEVVLEQLLALMRQGKLKPGDRLPSEADLCSMIGVGRSSVREAVRALAFMGVIESKPGRGSVVVMRMDNPIPPRDAAYALHSSAMLELYEVRGFLEGGTAALAAKRATPADLAAIEQAMRATEVRFARRQSAFRENVEFHLAIARGAHNNILSESLRRLLNQIREFRQQATDPVPGLPSRDVREHRAILKAIREGKSSRAQALMMRHIATAVRAVGLVWPKKAESSNPGAAVSA
jgi:GntR family transcriptional repressor for pyruvate dehydrogenase complex